MNRKLLIFPIGSEYLRFIFIYIYLKLYDILKERNSCSLFSLFLPPPGFVCLFISIYCPQLLSSTDKPTLYHLITNKTIDKDFPFISVFVFNRADPTKIMFNVFPYLTYPFKVIENWSKNCANPFIFFVIIHLYAMHAMLRISGSLFVSSFYLSI